MTISQPLLIAPLLVFLASITIADIGTHRIPNSFVVTAGITALCLQSTLHGWQGLASALGGFAIAFALFLPFYLVRAFGAGDVKAMGAVGGFMSPKLAFAAVLATLIAGSVLAIVFVLARNGDLKAVFYRVIGLMASPTRAVQPNDARTSERFPYAGAIALGSVCALIWSGQISFT
jgi:prepilin peptidase CpaA